MTDPLSELFAALSDPTRRDIITRLTEGETTISELASQYPMSLQAVAKHLQVLETAGVVSRRRDGRRRPIHLEAQVFDLMDQWRERYRRQVEDRYQRLDHVLAAETTANQESVAS